MYIIEESYLQTFSHSLEIPVSGEADTDRAERYGERRIYSCTGQVQRTPSAGCDNQLQIYRHTPRQFTL